MGVRNYMRKRQVRKLEKERDSMIMVREIGKLQQEIKKHDGAIKMEDHLRDLDDLERQVILEGRIKKLKARQL